jgi:ATP-dependent RNA helicase DDX3X
MQNGDNNGVNGLTSSFSGLGVNGRPAYVPPHLRKAQQQESLKAAAPEFVPKSPISANGAVTNGTSPASNGTPAVNGHAPAALNGTPNGAYRPPVAAAATNGAARNGGGGWDTAAPRPGTNGAAGGRGNGWSANTTFGSGRRNDGYGHWQDGQHIIGPANPRTEKELFGEAGDGITQSTGINFDKYGDIPVSVTPPDPRYTVA